MEKTPEQKLLEDIGEYVAERERLAREYKVANEAGKVALLEQYPQLHEFILYQEALESVPAARDWAIRNEGNRLII